ncbi:MAG: ribonuclease domain-containing protein [Rhodocyclaceae bacterium]|nr:ribonuclease domain-containing protein [Rhodocyclaceae bacterium]
MPRFIAFLFALCLLAASSAWARESLPETPVHALPREARDTLALIHRGGPFPFRRDGIVFGNFEHRLPQHPRGYYHEYTVPTPGERNRGARRIVAGEGPGRDVRTSGEYWYSDDHYRSFSRIRE